MDGDVKTKSVYCLEAKEQQVLEELGVRLVKPSEKERFDQLIGKHHYLHNANYAGRALRYVAQWKSKWLALLMWSSSAYHLKAREAWIGWSETQRRQRLPLVVNNSRFLILPEAHYPNLASRVMGLCLKRLSQDWEREWGHEVLVAESFVDSQLFRGTSYKVSGWTLLGQTQGFGRCAQDFYVEHERPKQLWVRELRSGGRELLRSEALPPPLAAVENELAVRCAVPVPQLRGMWAFFHHHIQDWRSPFGLRYRLATVLTIIACAGFCGVSRGQRDLAAFARRLTHPQRRALRCPRNKLNRALYDVPEETTFFRVLTRVDPLQVEQALQAWQNHALGPLPKSEMIVLDGKEPAHAGGVEIVSALAVPSLRWLGSEQVAKKSNEIPAVQRLIPRLDLEGRTVITDAMHTQNQTARQIVFEAGGDYLFTVKDNQKGLRQTIQSLLKTEAVPPSGPIVAHPDAGLDRGNQSRSA